MIICRHPLKSLGFMMDFFSRTIEWNDVIIPMKESASAPIESFHTEDPGEVEKMVGSLAGNMYKKILQAKYEKADLEKEVNTNSPQLNPQQQQELNNLSNKFEQLFNGTLGTWKDTKYNIELKEGATPYHGRPYSIPQAYYQQLQLEVERLVKIGVLRKLNHSELGAPTFIVPKKDQTIRFLLTLDN